MDVIRGDRLHMTVGKMIFEMFKKVTVAVRGPLPNGDFSVRFEKCEWRLLLSLSVSFSCWPLGKHWSYRIIEGRYSVFLLLAEGYIPVTSMKIKTYSRNKCCDFLRDHDRGDQAGFFICNGGKIRVRCKRKRCRVRSPSWKSQIENFMEIVVLKWKSW